MKIFEFKKTWLVLALIAALGLLPPAARALVNYEAGRLQVNGILLLQDTADPNTYYYLPPAPRVSQRKDGGLEFSMIKFVDPAGETSGGLFHMLVSLSLPADELAALEKGLKKINSKARLAGPVPLKQEAQNTFSIISGTLSNKQFTTSLIASGRAPVTPGSKAAVAATLSPHGATLLWESLQKPTSDVSVALRTYYEAALPSFTAKINAEVSTVYTHFSKLDNKQHRYNRKQVRDIVDELVRTGDIKVEVMDRMPEDRANKAMQSLVDMVTGKLTEIIFDQKTGFTAIPEKEKAVEAGQVKGRQKKGWLAKLFTSTGNQKYYTDNQYVLKKREDINRAVFSINLNRRAVIKVPVDTAGNISGLYKAFGDDPEMFRVVNLADPAFQKREIFFRIDGDYATAFEKIMNYAGVSVKKTYKGQADATGELVFTREDIRDGRLGKSWKYARLGQSGSDWLNYGFRTIWSIQGQHKIATPQEPDAWLQSADPIITLAPPLERLDLEIDADRFLFEDAAMRSATLEVRYTIFGAKKKERFAVMRATDAESVSAQVLFHDPKSDIQYRVNWYPAKGKPAKGEWTDLDDTYLVLTPPGL
ncbi:MAG: hypothetical protein HUN04_11055 [Desulfobacter sp.]|nr:MAG: hypothetical protein HUN04_11055 [Desulfobacter sp.]